MAEIKDKELLEIIFAQTHIKDENDEDIPYFCFITDISDEFDLSEEDIAVLALKNGYSVLKPFADETMLGGYILCAEGCGKEQVEQMYQDVYDEVPEIAEIVLGENDTLVEKGKEENKEEPTEVQAEEEQKEEPLKESDESILGYDKEDLFEMSIDELEDLKTDIVNEREGLPETSKKGIKLDDLLLWVEEAIAHQESKHNIKVGDKVIVHSFGDIFYDDLMGMGGLSGTVKEIDTDDGIFYCDWNYPEDFLDTLSNAEQKRIKHKMDNIGVYFDDDFEIVSNESLKEEKADKNQLKDRQKKHKKSDKKGARGWFVNPNAGDVEKNTAFFNNAMGNPAPAQADGGIGCVGCAEGLNESKIDDIDKFIEDIYALRKESIATEGEYGKGNLIFKELRNNGYLQKLKDLKAKEQSKQLSLEGLKEEKFDANQNFKMGKKAKE